MPTKWFGTDGVRGPVGGVIHPETILKLGWAAGKVLAEMSQNKPKVLIGKDTRVSGYLLESALESGFSAAGVDVELLGPMPTPAIAYLTHTLRATAGVVISASHNPFSDNGIKFFLPAGQKLSPQRELQIEALMEKPMQVVSSHLLGKASRLSGAQERYIEYCKGKLNNKYSLQGLKVVVDCAHGATYSIAPKIFSELGANVEPIFVNPNGFNINEGCGSTHPESLVQTVLESRADLGFAFDGDGDRVLAVSNKGRILNGDDLLYIMLTEEAKSIEGLVGTVMTGLGLEKSLQAKGKRLVRASVGDKHVMKKLRELNWSLGGEPSGHLIHRDKMITGDGIIAAIQVVNAVVGQQKSLSDFELPKVFPNRMLNVPVANSVTREASEHINLQTSIIQKELGDQYRVVVRPSGTEPVVRVFVEGENEAVVHRSCDSLVDMVVNAVV
jgi:phosphoglucosamine mutase